MERQCLCCHTRFTLSRNKNQRYCNKQVCQKKRRSSHQKQKLKIDTDYKDTHTSSQKKWRANNPDYWRLYRNAHPEYANNNRKKQKARDQRSLALASGRVPCVFRNDTNIAIFAKNIIPDNLANMYSLISKNVNFSYSYEGILLGEKHLANMYSIAAVSYVGVL